MSKANTYCAQLGISVPTLEAVRDQPDANVFALMLVALLKRGEAMTLAEIADRFERADIASSEDALASLKRCRPGRAPVYRTGDHYALDPHDDELDLWAFRLGLRPPRVRSKPTLRLAPSPIPDDDEVALSVAELDEAWRSSGIQNWSAQRIALAVLDAHAGPMAPTAVIEFVNARTPHHRLRVESSAYWRSGAAIRVADDGRWEIAERGDELRSARRAVRERIAMDRKWPTAARPPPSSRRS